MEHNLLNSEELTAIEQYIHVATLIVFGCLLLLSSYQMCLSSINDQPKIKYRFTTMLYCFVEFIIYLLATAYFLIDSSNTKWRHSTALFTRLCLMTGRILASLCAYAFFLTVVKSLYCTPQHRARLPRWFKVFTKIFCATIMILDIIQTALSFIIGTTYAQSIFMFILTVWMLLFSFALLIALSGAKKQIHNIIHRTQGPYANSVISPKNHERLNRLNPSSSKFDIRNVVLPKTVNMLDIDSKSVRSQHVDTDRLHLLKRRLMRINTLIIFNIIAVIILIAGGWYSYYTDLYRITSKESFPSLTTSPMAHIEVYIARAIPTMMYIVSLLWWLYIPKSCCCDNIARDSLYFACCINCCDAMKPSKHMQRHIKHMNHNNEENSTDFDFFDVGTWKADFRISTYRSMDVGDNNMDDEDNNMDDEDVKRPLHDPDTSVTFDSAGDKDYNDIATVRRGELPDWGSDDVFQKSKSEFVKVHDDSIAIEESPPNVSEKKGMISAVYNTALS